jgi:hypothetical protein
VEVIWTYVSAIVEPEIHSELPGGLILKEGAVNCRDFLAEGAKVCLLLLDSRHPRPQHEEEFSPQGSIV